MLNNIADGLVYFAVFLLSTTLHEAAHAWVAKRGGDLTAYHGGQVTLDPIPHIRREPFGMLILPLLTVLISGFPFGFASAPYDPRWAMQHPKRAAWMSLAGPGANLLIVILSAIAIRVLAAQGIVRAPQAISFGHIAASEAGGWWPAVAFMLGAFFCMNLLLAAFNLLPLPPLDGSGALPLLLSDETSRKYQQFIWQTPGIRFMGLFLAWQFFGFLFRPILVGAVNLLYPSFDYR